MRDKQIMIDGVDVSKCYRYQKKTGYCKGAFKPEELPFCENFDCEFKRLARKTQECETLASQLDFEVQKKECLEQECEKLKSQVDEDYNYYTTELKTLRDIISNKEKRNAALFLTSGRYRKALEEIENYICEYEMLGKLNIKYILDIINKAKGRSE